METGKATPSAFDATDNFSTVPAVSVHGSGVAVSVGVEVAVAVAVAVGVSVSVAVAEGPGVNVKTKAGVELNREMDELKAHPPIVKTEITPVMMIKILL